ncbi:MAG: hypothetical protein ABEJ76_01220 [Halanaeroarchaeum sp.]
MSADSCEQSRGLHNPTLLGVGLLLIGLGVLPYLGVPVFSEWTGSWAFAVGAAVGIRGYSGGCLSGLVPGVEQCSADGD